MERNPTVCLSYYKRSIEISYPLFWKNSALNEFTISFGNINGSRLHKLLKENLPIPTTAYSGFSSTLLSKNSKLLSSQCDSAWRWIISLTKFFIRGAISNLEALDLLHQVDATHFSVDNFIAVSDEFTEVASRIMALLLGLRMKDESSHTLTYRISWLYSEISKRVDQNRTVLVEQSKEQILSLFSLKSKFRNYYRYKSEKPFRHLIYPFVRFV